MNNAHTGEREKVAFLYAIDGSAEVKAEFDRIIADLYPDKGLDADAAVKLQDEFTKRLKFFITGPMEAELHKSLSYGARALALTGIIEEKDGRRSINVTKCKDTQLTFPAKMLQPDKPFVMPDKDPLIVKVSEALSITCIRVPAGKFLMGAPFYQFPRWQEDPPHLVTLTKPFYMAECPVTQEVYEAVMGANPSAIKNPKMPVHRVSCADMYKFCKRLSDKIGRKVRVPTNAEWEYVARVGTSSPTFVEKYREQSSNAKPVWASEPMPVKSKKPNAWGFYDMHSGGWERVADTNGTIDRGEVTDPAHIPPEDRGATDPARKHGHFGKGQWSYPISEPEYITSEDKDERGYYRFRIVVETDGAVKAP